VEYDTVAVRTVKGTAVAVQRNGLKSQSAMTKYDSKVNLYQDIWYVIGIRRYLIYCLVLTNRGCGMV
jgi:hypothetical protein